MNCSILSNVETINPSGLNLTPIKKFSQWTIDSVKYASGSKNYQNFRDKTKCKVYDVDKNRSLNSLGDVINSNFIFVCLPTPMRYGGECDLSILDSFFEELPDHITGTFIIKSTVPVGTTKKYLERHNVIHNPEFLTARNAIQDFANSERNIIGGEVELCNDFLTLFHSLIFQ